MELVWNHEICLPTYDRIPETHKISKKELREATHRENSARYEKSGSSETVDRMGLRKVLVCGGENKDSAKENHKTFKLGKNTMSGTSIVHKDKILNLDFAEREKSKLRGRDKSASIPNSEMDTKPIVKDSPKGPVKGVSGELNFDFLHGHWAKAAIHKNLCSVLMPHTNRTNIQNGYVEFDQEMIHVDDISPQTTNRIY